MIGCDPELLIFKGKDQITSATEVYHVLKIPRTQRIGDDHSGRVVELRPEAVDTPEDLVDNLQDLLYELYAKTGAAYPLFGGSSADGARVSIGGHIHIDDPKAVLEGRGIIPALDTALGLPFRLIDKVEHVQQRLDRGYGDFGDIRKKTYGFEYRTPPSWLVSVFWTNTAFLLADALVKYWANTKNTLPTILPDLRDETSARVAKTKFEKYTIPLWKAVATGNPVLARALRTWTRIIDEDRKWRSHLPVCERWDLARPEAPNLFIDQRIKPTVRAAAVAARGDVKETEKGLMLYSCSGSGITEGPSDASIRMLALVRRIWRRDHDVRRMSYRGVGEQVTPSQISKTVATVLGGENV